MSEIILMKLLEIQPSQLYVSEEQLAEEMEAFDPNAVEPVAVAELDGNIIFTEGQARALAAHLHGLTEIPVRWDEDELYTDAYRICIGWCLDEGVRTVADLKDRVLSSDQFEIMWVRRCDAMLEELEHHHDACECE